MVHASKCVAVLTVTVHQIGVCGVILIDTRVLWPCAMHAVRSGC